MPLNKDVGNWIKDFMKSNAPQFKGKSKEERKDMALAAYREKYGSLEEAIDVNDPALAAFRAQMAARKKKAAEPKKSINPNYAAVKNADKIRALKQQRAQIMIDMEQEAEPEGGPIADRYGDMLNKIDAAIARLQGRKEMDYDTAVGKKGNEYMSKDEIERRAAMMKEEVDQRNADTYAYQFMQYFDKIRRVVAHNFGDDTRKEFERLVQDKFSRHNVNEAAKPDFLDVDKDGDKEETMKKALKDKALKKIKEIVKVKTPEEAAKVSKENPDAEVEVVSEVLTEGHKFDYEGKMAQSQLLSIVKNARDLFNMMDEKSQLKSWVQSKLTKAEDYLDAVRTYLEGEALSSTVPAMVENDRVSDETGTALSIGDVVKGGDGRIYQIVFSASEGKPSLVPFDLKRRKITTLRDKVYFDDQESSVPKKLNKVMDFSATKGGFMS